MITVECPWCAEPAVLEEANLDELACGACGITVEVAADPCARDGAQSYAMLCA